MDGYTETGPFDKPDRIVKRDLLSEEHDEIERLGSVINKLKSGVIAMSLGVVVLSGAVAYKYSQEDVRLIMVSRDDTGQETFWKVDGEYAPSAALIHTEAQRLIWNMRRVSTDINVTMDLRKDAIRKINAPPQAKDAFEASEYEKLKQADDLATTVSEIRSKEPIAPGRLVTVEWTETLYNVKTGQSQRFEMTTDLIPSIVPQSNKNPAGVVFNLPSICFAGNKGCI